jgi:hypothetical protein
MPSKPLQPTQAAKPFGQLEPSPASDLVRGAALPFGRYSAFLIKLAT